MVSTIGVLKEYGMKSSDGIFLVIRRLAIFPFAMLPCVSLKPIAYAPFIVEALIACRVLSFIFMHAKEIINFISPEGHDPGL